MTNGVGGVFSVFNAAVNVAYAPDLFGGGRRQIEAQDAQAEARRFELQATYQTLAANVVTTAVQQASLQAQLDAARESVASADALFATVQRQFDTGASGAHRAVATAHPSGKRARRAAAIAEDVGAEPAPARGAGRARRRRRPIR